MQQKPKTIENRWDILYNRYPEIYDEFADVPRNPSPMHILLNTFDLKNKIVADIGSGSGQSTFDIAEVASRVIGVERENSMIDLVNRKSKQLNIKNVKFEKGDAEKIPLQNNSVDVVTAILLVVYPFEKFIKFIHETIRVTKKNGLIIFINDCPGWYGGELAKVIDYNNNEQKYDNMLVNDLGFNFKDFYAIQEYGSMAKILNTYGFIFGKRAIKYLKNNKKTSIKWKFRIHYKEVS